MSIDFYQKNAEDFHHNTINTVMTDIYEPFCSRLKSEANILEAGCGSGRDVKAFKEMGYKVEAFDASSELVEIAKEVTGIEVKLATFNEFKSDKLFDAIWSCASLLHVPRNELHEVINYLSNFLKPGGYWYMSFKYGDKEREVEGRKFTDMNECKINKLLSEFNNLLIEQMWTSEDQRPDRAETWINVILRKA